MHTFISLRQFLNPGPADWQLDALTIRTQGAQLSLVMMMMIVPNSRARRRWKERGEVKGEYGKM